MCLPVGPRVDWYNCMFEVAIGILIIACIVLGLFVFGLFSTPYFEAFRFLFYLLLLLLVLIMGIEFTYHPFQGYTPTARTP